MNMEQEARKILLQISKLASSHLYVMHGSKMDGPRNNVEAALLHIDHVAVTVDNSLRNGATIEQVPHWDNSDEEHTLSQEKVNHPKHYNSHPSGVECIDIIEHMPFNIGTAIKYLWRAGLKEGAPTVEDYDKAIWYIHRENERLYKMADWKENLEENLNKVLSSAKKLHEKIPPPPSASVKGSTAWIHQQIKKMRDNALTEEEQRELDELYEKVGKKSPEFPEELKPSDFQ